MSNWLEKMSDAILKNPHDELSARITDTGRKVLKISIDDGKHKYSRTEYENGTTVETKTTIGDQN